MPDITDISPALSERIASQGVTDFAGGVAYSGITSADADLGTEIAFGGPTADFILYGVVNGAFAQGPPDPDSNIEPTNNPLPYWSGPTQVSGGAVTVSWVEDTGSPSGHVLRMTMHPGAASDEAYVEQIVPVGGDRFRALADAVRAAVLRVTATSNNFLGVVGLQYLTASYATTGNATEATTAWTADSQLQGGYAFAHATSAASVPANASYLRIRIGVRRNSAGTGDSGVFDFTDVRRDRGVPLLLVPENDGSGSYGAGQITQSSGTLSVQRDGGSGGEVIIQSTVVDLSPAARVTGTLQVTSDTTLDGDLNVGGTLTVADERTVGGWTVVEKSTDEDVTNSAAIQDDDELQFSTSTGISYLIEGVIEYQLQSGTAADLKIDLGTDSTARGVYTCRGFSTADAAQLSTILGNQTETATFGGTTTVRIVEIAGWHRSAGGTWKLRWAQNAATVGVYTRVRAGSYLRYRAV